MALPRRKLPGANDIRSLTRRNTRVLAPHAAYMKITSLELEKLRLNNARNDASRRVAEIDARLRAIEAEKLRLIQAMARVRERGNAAGASMRPANPRGLDSRGPGAVAIKY